MITFKFLRFPFVMCVPHTVNELVTDIILNITSRQEDLMLTLLHIGSRLFELFGKEVLVKKQTGRHLNQSKNRSNEGCSKFKSPETRQVQETLVSTLEHLQVPEWDRTRCPEE